jgi:ubiquinone/menaquinone biosynthesis C-methylase UbiE
MEFSNDTERETTQFNRSVYATYYRNPLVGLRYDLRYRARRIANLLRKHGVDPARPGFAAFEYGFGEGQLLRVVRNASSVVGFEMSASAVDRAMAMKPTGHGDWRMTKWEDATSLPLEDDSFDMVTASHVLEHVPNDERALSELVRIARPGGHVLVILPANERLFPGSKHLRVYRRDDFREQLWAAGLEEIEVDEHQRFDRPFKAPWLILQSRRGLLRKALLEGTKTALFLPAQLASWKTLAVLDEALGNLGAPSSSIAYLFRKR